LITLSTDANPSIRDVRGALLFCQRLEVFLLGRFAHFIILLGKLAVGGLLSRVCLSLDALNSIERSL
jgi:hypothetical protein